ncbi:proton-coupled zinc antiporter SLC30A1 [Euwallacea fornicatus]|uniref:proton-coupled zinc antiporter SLC30A1 n=1 Tax=Euwallacea fornicatus TaxID=995702 RepID=UPI00338E3E55
MPVKDFVRKFQPVQLYAVLTLTVLFFIVELIVSHLTHALTLLMDSYHMLCNILALTGCIITIKYENPDNNKTHSDSDKSESQKIEEITLQTECQDQKGKKVSLTKSKQETKLKNTFGWARIDVITMLMCCVFLASFSFSVYVEALQTLVHIGHQDAMHQPISVLCIGSAGLLLHGLCYLLIGGFTFHQGSFLYVTESGDVVLNKVVVNGNTKQLHNATKKRQGLWEMTRDVVGCVLVIICSLTVIFIDPQMAKYVDPVVALVSSTTIMVLSYPYIKESCLILLQTIPDTINIDSMRGELMKHFPDIKNVHDFHIWQMTASKVISTVHLIFENPQVYHTVMKDIKEFFIENGVTQVTIQPEFFQSTSSLESLVSSTTPRDECLMACQGDMCKFSHCCPLYNENEANKFKYSSKEIMPTMEDRATPILKSVKIIDYELSSSSYSINSLTSKSGSERTVKDSIKNEESSEAINEVSEIEK